MSHQRNHGTAKLPSMGLSWRQWISASSSKEIPSATRRRAETWIGLINGLTRLILVISHQLVIEMKIRKLFCQLWMSNCLEKDRKAQVLKRPQRVALSR